MGGRAVVAVVTPGGFLGVAHDLRSEPWNLGNALLYEAVEREGDLASLAADLVFLAPGGWRSFPEKQQRDPDEHLDEPMLYGADELRSQAWLGWMYVLDVAARRLTVYAGNPHMRTDTRLPPLARVQFDAEGVARPPVFAQPPPPWPGIPVLDGWSQDDADLRRVRDRLDRALTGPDGGAAFRATLSGLLREVIAGAEWRSPAPLESAQEKRLRERIDHHRADPRRPSVTDTDPLCVPFNWDNEDGYWEVDVDGVPVRYPPGALRSPDGALRLYRLDGQTAVIRDLEAQLRERASDHDEGATRLERLGRSMRFWENHDHRSAAAIDALVDSLNLAFGSTEGLAWWLLDWLRLGVIPIPEDRAGPSFPYRYSATTDAPPE